MTYSITEYSYYNENEILALYASVGWTNYTRNPCMLKASFENSSAVLGAYDGHKLIGIVRAVGDNASIVFIQDILVLPEYQRKGVGTALLKSIMERFRNVYQMVLMTDNTEETVSFYKSLGFIKADEAGCCAFVRIFRHTPLAFIN